MNNKPIGIFDSGIGGLTVAQAVAKQLPHENLIYFGDTAHLPYGDKSAQTIQRYCKDIVDFLLDQECKVILIACNSATAAAYDILQSYVGDKAVLLGVIDPVVSLLQKQFRKRAIGLIGTKQTISSKIFEKKIAALPNELTLKAMATPLLVPIIEEGFHHHVELVDQVLGLYLNQPLLQQIDALVLACTHYPVIKSRINNFYQGKVQLFDASEITAQALAALLEKHNLLNSQQIPGQHQFFVSDYTDAFAQMAWQFFGEKIPLRTCSLARRD